MTNPNIGISANPNVGISRKKKLNSKDLILHSLCKKGRMRSRGDKAAIMGEAWAEQTQPPLLSSDVPLASHVREEDICSGQLSAGQIKRSTHPGCGTQGSTNLVGQFLSAFPKQLLGLGPMAPHRALTPYCLFTTQQPQQSCETMSQARSLLCSNTPWFPIALGEGQRP